MRGAPGTRFDYGARELEAVHRALVDLGQVLGSLFEKAIVVVGGLVPALLLDHAEEPHAGTVDIDLALDPERLDGGLYAEIPRLLCETGRYELTEQPFKLQTLVDLDDGEPSFRVDIDFLKPRGGRHATRGRRLAPGFRPFDADAGAAAFRNPAVVEVAGLNIDGVENRVRVRVIALEDFLVMKAYAVRSRAKAKDAYDLCYCLEHAGIEPLAAAWRARRGDELVDTALDCLREKFVTVDSLGPQQVATFKDAASAEGRARDARRAFELVARFLLLIDR